MEFGELFRARRKLAGWTLRDVSSALGISSAYVSMVERGLKLPMSDDLLVTMAKTWGTDPGELIQAAGAARGFFRVPADGDDHNEKMARAVMRCIA